MLMNTTTISSDGSKNCFLPLPLTQGFPQNQIRLQLKSKECMATSEAIWPSSNVYFLPKIPCFCLLTCPCSLSPSPKDSRFHLQVFFLSCILFGKASVWRPLISALITSWLCSLLIVSPRIGHIASSLVLMMVPLPFPLTVL